MLADRNIIQNLNDRSKGLSVTEIIRLAYDFFGGRIKLASSLGEEDQVLTDLIARTEPRIQVFTLDTGRLFPETYELLAKTQRRYSLPYMVYFPDSSQVEDMVRTKGINLFYDSVENRKLCCHVRKVAPLQRALSDADAWICGLRRGQAVTRRTLEVFELDEVNHKVKISPLAGWSLEQVRDYIDKNHVDINPLHQQGFISIGCSCCTRAVQPGEDIRAGRWWWEEPQHKECGLHNRGQRPELGNNPKA